MPERSTEPLDRSTDAERGIAPRISGHTKLAMLLGTPVAHSLSPAIHNTSFAALGIDAVYLVADVTAPALPAALSGARVLGMLGLNVTMPHKAAVIPYLDSVTSAAEFMGAVNTIAIENGKMIGHNTDGAGLLRSISEAGFPVRGSSVTILGAGGAATAAFTQAALDGASRVTVFNHRSARFAAAEERLAALHSQTGVPCTIHDLADNNALAAAVAASDIVINATPAGMAPRTDSCLVDEAWLHAGQAVADTVYFPIDTVLLQRAAHAGATPINGLGMLLWQAAIAEEIWTGQHMPVDFIRQTVLERL
jgi:shikimate 5-dehydrogenase